MRPTRLELASVVGLVVGSLAEFEALSLEWSGSPPNTPWLGDLRTYLVTFASLILFISFLALIYALSKRATESKKTATTKGGTVS